MTDQRLYGLMARFVEEAIFRTTYPARLGKGDGQTLWVSGRAGYAWARIQFPSTLSTRQIRVHKINAAYGAPIEVRVARDGELEAVGSDGSEIAQYADGSGFVLDMPTHGVTHQYNGSDPLFIDSLQVSPLRCRPNDTPGLSVYIDPAKYIDANSDEQTWDGGSLDLTSKVPSSVGHQVIIIVGLDKASGTLTTADGTSAFYVSENSITIPFTRAEAVAVTQPDDFEPSAAVRLYYAQTRIDRVDIFMDMRNWLGSAGSGALLDTILTDANGDVVSDSNGDVLYE